jgi:thioredoxin 1
MSYVNVTDDNFDSEVLKASGPVLVDFWAPWCGPCRMVGPIIEKLADEFSGKVKIAKLNVDENPAIAQKYNIMSIPTMKFFKDGEIAEEMIGAQPENILRDKLNYYAGK